MILLWLFAPFIVLRGWLNAARSLQTEVEFKAEILPFPIKEGGRDEKAN